MIQEVTGPVSFLVKLESGRLVRRHQNHLRYRLPSNGVEIPQNSPPQEQAFDEVESDSLIGIPLSPTTVVGPPESTPEQDTGTTPSPTVSPVADERSPETVEDESNEPNGQPDNTQPPPSNGPVPWETT